MFLELYLCNYIVTSLKYKVYVYLICYYNVIRMLFYLQVNIVPIIIYIIFILSLFIKCIDGKIIYYYTLMFYILINL